MCELIYRCYENEDDLQELKDMKQGEVTLVSPWLWKISTFSFGWG